MAVPLLWLRWNSSRGSNTSAVVVAVAAVAAAEDGDENVPVGLADAEFVDAVDAVENEPDAEKCSVRAYGDGYSAVAVGGGSVGVGAAVVVDEAARSPPDRNFQRPPCHTYRVVLNLRLW